MNVVPVKVVPVFAALQSGVHGREYALGTRSTNLQSLVNMVRVQKGTYLERVRI